jgi:hypothetical protein
MYVTSAKLRKFTRVYSIKGISEGTAWIIQQWNTMKGMYIEKKLGKPGKVNVLSDLKDGY